MGKRKIKVKRTVAKSIAEAAWYIESKGMVATAENFADSVYNFFQELSNQKRIYRPCQEPKRAALGFKCVNFKKYTVVFIESEMEVTICEFIQSKLIWW